MFYVPAIVIPSNNNEPVKTTLARNTADKLDEKHKKHGYERNEIVMPPEAKLQPPPAPPLPKKKKKSKFH